MVKSKSVGIYLIASPNSKFYIGQSWNLEGREKSYKYGSNKRQTKIFNSIKKYGWDQHSYTVLIKFEENEINQNTLDLLEVFYWSACLRAGLEMLNVRYPGSGGRHSQETKDKLSIIHTGKQLSEEHKKAIGKSLEGGKRSDFTRKLLSSQKEGSNNPQYGKTGFNSKDGIAVQQLKKGTYELVATFGSIKEAERLTGIDETCIGRVCRGLAKTAGGFSWRHLIK